MNDNEKFEIDGLKEVMDILSDLPDRIQNNILKSYLSKTVNRFIVQELKSKLNYSSETERNIRVTQDRKNYLAYFGGPTTKSFWLRFTDKGTKVRTTKKGANRGKIIARNQIEPTIMGQVQPIIDNATKDFGEEINRILEKRLKKLGKQ